MTKQFKVRVSTAGGPTMILRGGTDMQGFYVVTREPSGAGYTATPEKRVGGFPPNSLRRLPDGAEADYELTVLMSAKDF